jgi:hypothetical protein
VTKFVHRDGRKCFLADGAWVSERLPDQFDYLIILELDYEENEVYDLNNLPLGPLERFSYWVPCARSHKPH